MYLGLLCWQILELPPAHLAQLLRCVEDGLCAQETVLMQSCATLGHFVEFIFKHRNSEEKEGDVRLTVFRSFLSAIISRLAFARIHGPVVMAL